MILVTTPAPTVLPPSRMAKRICSSSATGVISSMSTVGRIVGPLLGTLIFARYGYAAPYWVASAFLALGLSQSMPLRRHVFKKAGRHLLGGLPVGLGPRHRHRVAGGAAAAAYDIVGAAGVWQESISRLHA